MKRLYIMLFLTFGFANVYAQDAQKPLENKNAPVITFDQHLIQGDEAVYDYGTIEKGSDGTCYFVFTNTGKEPLLMEKTSSCCGTVTKLPTDPILPGQRDSISVKYNTNRAAPITKTISVFSNAANSPVTIRVKGTIVDPEAGATNN